MTRRRPAIPALDDYPDANPTERAEPATPLAVSVPSEPLRSPTRPGSSSIPALDRAAAIRAGLEAARARGVRIGRPPVAEELRTRVLDLAGAGLSARRIALEAGCALVTVRRILTGRR